MTALSLPRSSSWDGDGFGAAAAVLRRDAAELGDVAERMRHIGRSVGHAGWRGSAATAAAARTTDVASSVGAVATALTSLAVALATAADEVALAVRGRDEALAAASREAARRRVWTASRAFLVTVGPSLARLSGSRGAAARPATAAPTMPTSAAPGVVAAWWAALPAPQREHLLAWAPQRLGGLDGLPSQVRDRANLSVLAALRRETEADLDALSARRPTGVSSYAWAQGGTHALAARAGELHQRLALLEVVRVACAPEGRLLLDLDPRDAGRALVAVGDPDTAAHVAVLVPGMGTTVLGDLPHVVRAADRLRTAAEFHTARAARTAGAASPPAGALGARPGAVDTSGLAGARRSAATVAAESATAIDGGVAVVAWLGYRAPTAATVLFDDRARGAVPDLRRTLEGLDARAAQRDGRQHVTLVGHSYGSLVSGLAVRTSAPVDDLVLMGSPGVGVDEATTLHLRSGRVFVVEAPGDPIADTGYFGRDPSSRAFGAVALATVTGADGAAGTPVWGHSHYLDSGTASLDNVAAVVSGRPPSRATR